MKTYLMTQVKGQIVSGNLMYGPLNFFVYIRPSKRKSKNVVWFFFEKLTDFFRLSLSTFVFGLVGLAYSLTLRM